MSRGLVKKEARLPATAELPIPTTLNETIRSLGHSQLTSANNRGRPIPLLAVVVCEDSSSVVVRE